MLVPAITICLQYDQDESDESEGDSQLSLEHSTTIQSPPRKKVKGGRPKHTAASLRTSSVASLHQFHHGAQLTLLSVRSLRSTIKSSHHLNTDNPIYDVVVETERQIRFFVTTADKYTRRLRPRFVHASSAIVFKLNSCLGCTVPSAKCHFLSLMERLTLELEDMKNLWNTNSK